MEVDDFDVAQFMAAQRHRLHQLMRRRRGAMYKDTVAGFDGYHCFVCACNSHQSVLAANQVRFLFRASRREG